MTTMSTLNESQLEMPTPFLQEVAKKIYNSERLSGEEGLKLLESSSPAEQECVRILADYVRKRKNGDTVHYANTLYIHPTNLCELNCPFCSFYAKPGWEKAWFLTPAQVEEKIRLHLSKGLTEIHIVGGLWRDCNLDYYKEVFSRIKALDPNLHIKALTSVEYDFLAKLHDITIEEVLTRMISWGLGSITGGGAEILVEEIRKKIAPGKISSDEYLNVHALAHKLNLPSNITMLFGHIETKEHIITHLMRVRALQDETNGFKAFIPLKFGEENNALGKRKKQLQEKYPPLLYAVSRLMLDNIQHLKVLWNYVGVDLAMEILRWGGNDLSSTNLEEKIIVMAGSTAMKMDPTSMEALILKAGRTPKMTHSGAV